MKLLRTLLPHLTISLALALAVLAYVDNRNPLMSFLSSTAGWTLLYITAAVSIACAVMLWGRLRSSAPPEEPRRSPRKTREDDETEPW